MNPWFSIGTVLATLGVLMGAVKFAAPRLGLSPELSRKLIHVGMGLVTLSFPWLFDRAWPVMLLAAVAAAALLVVKCVQSLRTGIGSVLLGVDRTSMGEVYFPIAVGTLFYLSAGRWELFVIPMLILTLADAVAALIGVRYGTLNYLTLDGRKSAEGSVAFFTVAMLSVHVPLLLWTQIGRAETLLIALILGLLVMLLEAVSWRGLDNLFIPLGAYAFLRLYLPLPADALLARLVVTMVLVTFTLSCRRRSTLDDSSLIASALFAYVAAMAGGALWLVAPITLFLLQVLFWPPGKMPEHHNIYVFITITSSALFWLFVSVIDHDRHWIIPYAVSFAAHIAFVRMSRSAFEPIHIRPWQRLGGSIALGIAAGLAPTLLIVMVLPELQMADRSASTLVLDGAAALAGVVLPAVAFYRLIPRLYDPVIHPYLIHVVGGTLAFVGSLFAAARVLGM